VRETQDTVRLNKFLADGGAASRRAADEMITAGRVRVNGKVVTEMGVKVRPSEDRVEVDGSPVTQDPRLVYIVLNKPKDTITTTSDERGRNTVLDLVPGRHRLYPVGRLDRNTTGVLLLTNDGDLAWRLMHPSFHAPKVYRVTLGSAIRSADVEKLRRGVQLEDGITAPCEAEIIDPPASHMVGIILHEGRNRQVRRMFEALGHDVRKLERTGYAGLTCAGLRRGGWRFLEDHEVRALRALVSTQHPRPRRDDNDA
jgi:23S rRNA pseudouridine2605 synthase